MAELDPAVEQQLADLSDQDWSALTARVRPPTSREQFKSVAARVLKDEGQLNSFLSIANPKAFVSENGDVDEAKLTSHLTTLFGAGEPPQQRNWGQTTGQPAGHTRGDNAREALRARHNVGGDTQPGAATQAPRARSAKAELNRRYGKGRK